MLAKCWTCNPYVAHEVTADRRPAFAMRASNDNAHDVLPGPSAASASREGRDLRPIYVMTRDFGQLEHLARIRLSAGHPVGSFLLAALDRAIVAQPKDLPPDVAAMNSRPIFRRDDAAAGNRILLYAH